MLAKGGGVKLVQRVLRFYSIPMRGSVRESHAGVAKSFNRTFATTKKARERGGGEKRMR